MGRPLKRPLLVVAFQTERQANGGLESLALVLESLRDRPLHLLTQRESAVTTRLRAAGVGVTVAPFVMPEAQPTRRGRLRSMVARAPALAAGQARVAGLVRLLGAGTVLFNDPNAVLYGALGARLAGAQTVFAIRATAGIDGLKWRLIPALVDVVVSLSADLQQRYLDALASRGTLGRPRARFEVIPSVVRTVHDGEPRAAVRARLGVERDELAVGIVGGVIPVKRTRDAVRALGRAFAGRSGTRLYVLGDFDPAASPYAAACQAERDALPEPDRVRFVGYTPAMHDWYRALDVVAIASDDEGLSRAMIEALAHGVPVVSTDVCSAREVLEPTGAGRVVPLRDDEGLAREVLALLADEDARRRMGASGRAWVRANCEAAAVAARWDAVLSGAGRG